MTISRPHVSRHFRQNKATGKSVKTSRLVKQVYFLACITFITFGWVNAKYVREIAHFEEVGAVAKFNYVVNSATTKVLNSDTVLTASHKENGDVVSSGQEMLESVKGATSTTNYYDLSNDSADTANIEVTFKLQITSELRVAISLRSEYKGPEADQALRELTIENIDYSATDFTGVVSGTGANRIYTIDPPSNGTVTMVVTLKSTNSEYKQQYLDLIPVVTQVNE